MFHSCNAFVEPARKASPALGKVVLLFAFLQLHCVSPKLYADDTTASAGAPFTYSATITAEGESVDLQESRLNPNNILRRKDTRFEGFVLGEALYKKYGSTIYGELRLGYEYLEGESQGSPFDDSSFDVDVNQLYYRTYSGPFSFVVGRKKVRWGVGYSYSPTDLITQLRNPEDPQDRLSTIQGSDLVEVSYVSDNGQVDLIYCPVLDWDFENSFFEKNRAGVRWYRFVDPFDVAVVGRVDDDGEWAAGLNTSVTAGNALELHAEYLYTSENDRRYPDTGISPKTFVYPFLPQDGGVHEVLLGGHYTFENDLNLTLEYLFKSSGYTSEEFSSYAAHAAYLEYRFIKGVNKPATLAGLAEASANYSIPQRKHYLFSRVYHPELIESFSFELYSFCSLADGSGLVVLVPKYTASDYFDLYLRLEKFWGARDTEFGLVPEDISFIAGISLFWGK